MYAYKNYVDGLLGVAEMLIALPASQIRAHAAAPSPDRAIKCRVVSTLYYALFSELCGSNADALVGNDLRKAWGEVYRALNHKHAKTSCNRAEGMKEFPKAIRAFSGLFERSQRRRLDADYDPSVDFDRVEVETWCRETKRIITMFRRLSKKDRRAFAVWVLMHSEGSRAIRKHQSDSGGDSEPSKHRL